MCAGLGQCVTSLQQTTANAPCRRSESYLLGSAFLSLSSRRPVLEQ